MGDSAPPVSPKVSVLLPVRDGAATLETAVRSILGQTLRELECVVVDDGSVDATPALLGRLAAGDDRVRVIRQNPAGIAAALNRGLAQAQSDVIARMDADDWSHPERLEKQLALLNARPELDVVGCLVGFGGDAPGYARHVAWTNTLIDPETIARNRFKESPLPHPSAMLRRSVLDRCGAWREGDFPEDYELWLRLLDAGVRMAKVPETLLVWNDPPGRLSRSDSRYGQAAFDRIKAHYLARRLAEINPHHPFVHVIGAGRGTRRRLAPLLAAGIRVAGYIDIDPKKIGRVYAGAPVLARGALPGPDRAFALPFVGGVGVDAEIRAFLEERGFVVGVSFLEAI